MKMILAGGSGLLGSMICSHFNEVGHEIVVLSRNPRANQRSQRSYRTVPWDGKNLGSWLEEFEGADAVVNLAGRSVNCRYTPQNRRMILESRVDSTRCIGQAIAKVSRPPKVWLQASSATIYRHEYDRDNDEDTGAIDRGDYKESSWKFSVDVVRAWEAACHESQTPNTRKVLMRISLIMSPDRNSVFDVLLGLVRKGLGGAQGDGRQYVSWMHYLDFLDAVALLLESPIAGPVNLASPEPLPNRDFMRVLREVAGVPFGLPATRWMLELGAILMRTETELILKSRRVVPGVLLDAGYRFRFPVWTNAAKDLYERWAVRSSRADSV